MPRRDDEDEPSTSPEGRRRDSISHSDASELVDRRTARLFERQNEKLERFFEERERRAKERTKYENARVRRDVDLGEQIEKLSGHVSELYTRDMVDVDALRRLEREIEGMKRDLLSDMKELMAAQREVGADRDKLVGAFGLLKILGPAGVAIAGLLGGFLGWLLQHLGHP